LAGDYPGNCFVYQNIIVYISIHVGTMDSSKIQVRPVNEPWLENIAAFINLKYAGNRRINFIKTKSLAFLKLNDTFAAGVVILKEKYY